MKIKRFLAKDMRGALAQVKECLGDDAVIMSNKTVAGGIEIVAAVDFDADAVSHSDAGGVKTKRTIATDNVAQASHKRQANNTEADSLEALLARQQKQLDKQLQQNSRSGNKVPDWAQSQPEQNAASQRRAPSYAGVGKVDKDSQKQIGKIQSELAALRNLLTHQVAGLMSAQKQQRDPVGAMLEQSLSAAGFASNVAIKLGYGLKGITETEIQSALQHRLAGMLHSHGDEIIANGGVVALVGPTGVGKTTTIAKLAARFIARHGAQQVALVTTDHYRIGAYEQLATYGKIMGCPVKQANDLFELERVLKQLSNRKLVLIDTAGMGQRDTRLYQQLENLAVNHALPIQSYLVMSTTAQRSVLEDALSHFQQIPLSGVILTKIDESVSLAAALSVVIETELPLSYVTHGQRVPEDLALADEAWLAESALSCLHREEFKFAPDSTGLNDVSYAFE